MPAPQFSYFATCFRGLEPVLAGELSGPFIRAREVVPGVSGVAFSGDQGVGYRACLWLRSAIRVLAEIARAPASGPDELHAWACTLPWTEMLRLDQTFSVEARVWDSELTHSKFAALRVKDAVCDVFRDRTGARPNVDPVHAEFPLFLYLYQNEAVLYRDLAGTTLHKRGYRQMLHKSSLNEALAAGILLLSGWDGESPLADPLCGSGTFVIEAALLALHRAPGLMRKRFPFEGWPDFDRACWAACRDEAYAAARDDLDFPLGANDRHPGALGLARKDAQAADVDRFIVFNQGDVAEYVPPVRPAVVVANPPWGERLSGPQVAAAWKGLGQFLKGQCDGAEAWILSGSAEATRHMRLKAAQKFPVRNGKVDCRVLQYRIHGRGERPEGA